MRLPEAWPASCESRTNKVLDDVVSSVAKTTKNATFLRKVLRLPDEPRKCQAKYDDPTG